MITIAPTHYTQKTELLRKKIKINDQGSKKSAGKKKTPDRWKHTKEMRDRDPLLVLLFLRGPSTGRASLACTERGRRQTEHEAPV
jgi:hypothetical protein